MRKSIFNLVLVAAAFAAVTQNAFALVPPPNVPDGGATGALLVTAIVGLVAGKSLIQRKK